MNTLFINQYQQSMERGSMGFNSPVLSKKGLPYQSESLYGMALYDFDSIAADVGLQSPLTPFRPTFQAPPPVFHPVDEYKDLSLREILDLSDDFLSNDDDHFNPVDMTMEPVPFANKSSIQPSQVASSGTTTSTTSASHDAPAAASQHGQQHPWCHEHEQQETFAGFRRCDRVQ